jgi:very-short-patch-repair endonuclease
MLAGFSAGEISCPLWESIGKLCQTDQERKFLHWYLRYVKDRQFPMILPQVRIGIAERKRADFVAFVPLQYWRYKAVAIELDGAHTDEHLPKDQARDKYYEWKGSKSG